jgi:SAM-dependent methyltransferase
MHQDKENSASDHGDAAHSILDFYRWSRDYWIDMGKSSEGQSSGLLNFGLWRKDDTTLFDAQKHMCDEIFRQLPALASGALGLEIGSGIGGASVRLALERDVSLVCLDLLQEHLELGRARAVAHGLDENRIRYTPGSSMQMPFGAGEFDFSYCIESSFHYPDKMAFLRENFRVLKSGATTVIADITCSDNSKVAFRSGNYYCSSEDMVKWLQEAGFVEVRVMRIGEHVFCALYEFVEKYGQEHRGKLQRYWGLVLKNYENLWKKGLMGYDIFVATKPR